MRPPTARHIPPCPTASCETHATMKATAAIAASVPYPRVPGSRPGTRVRSILRESGDRRFDAARLIGDAAMLHGELDRAEGAQQHRLVEVAHVADAEDAPLQGAETAAEREVGTFHRHLPQP